MARVILEIPAGKMKSFSKLIKKLGIESRMVIHKQYTRTLGRKKKITQTLKKISQSFILFDWEFFSNELEFE